MALMAHHCHDHDNDVCTLQYDDKLIEIAHNGGTWRPPLKDTIDTAFGDTKSENIL